MPIIITEDDQPDARTLAIIRVSMMIEGAMTGDEEVDVYDVAEEIMDYLRPPARKRLPLTAMREWQERHRAEQLAEDVGRLDATFLALRQKPRIRVRAATQHTA